jgi:hypothetical protein
MTNFHGSLLLFKQIIKIYIYILYTPKKIMVLLKFNIMNVYFVHVKWQLKINYLK